MEALQLNICQVFQLPGQKAVQHNQSGASWEGLGETPDWELKQRHGQDILELGAFLLRQRLTAVLNSVLRACSDLLNE